MSEKKAPTLLNRGIVSSRKEIVKRKPVQAGPPTPEKPHRPTDEEHFEAYREDNAHISDAIQRLTETARGVGLILSSFDGEMDEGLAWQLGDHLRTVAEPVDAYYFGSPGELNGAIGSRHLQVLLKRKLNAVRVKSALNRKKK